MSEGGTIARLRRMADQIGKNFAAIGHDHAALATAEHIKKYWDPRMKAAIFADDHSHLSPIARAAVDLLVQGVNTTPPAADSQFNKVDEVGHSDAG
jgi:formate dehydrogenase subunit delta